MPLRTVVFADLTGSTGAYELLGNDVATDTVTGLTQWIGSVCGSHAGHVVKYLGDGVLMTFEHAGAAVNAATEMLREHQKRLELSTYAAQMRLKIGMERGPVVEQNGDCFGDAVNVASRLCDLAGSDQILISESVVNSLPAHGPYRYRPLGPMEIRGRMEPCFVFQVDWQEEVVSEFLTVAGGLGLLHHTSTKPPARTLELRSLDTTSHFQPLDLPIFLGRDIDSQFVVHDQRVSRHHAAIEWRNGQYYLSDVSSYGTWVKFQGDDAIVALRRQECPLHGTGEIALGASFDDFSVPIVSFSFSTI